MNAAETDSNDNLQELANTWLTCLLLPSESCAKVRDHARKLIITVMIFSTQRTARLPAVLTPTFDETAALTDHATERAKELKDKVPARSIKKDEKQEKKLEKKAGKQAEEAPKQK